MLDNQTMMLFKAAREKAEGSMDDLKMYDKYQAKMLCHKVDIDIMYSHFLDTAIRESMMPKAPHPAELAANYELHQFEARAIREKHNRHQREKELKVMGVDIEELLYENNWLPVIEGEEY